MSAELGVEKKQTQVSSEVDRQDRLLVVLNDFIDKLDIRLTSVLAPPSEQPVTADKDIVDTLTPLASQLSEYNRRIDSISSHLSGVLDRLEL